MSGNEGAAPTATIAPDAVIGPGARLAPGIRVGRGAEVRDGAVVWADVPALAVVAGDPAVVVGYSHTSVVRLPEAALPTPSRHVRRLPEVREKRGNLVVLERGADLPFEPRRCLLIHGVPAGGHRGNHAHRTLVEIVVCVHGSCRVLLDDGLGTREVVVLDHPGTAVIVPPYYWTAQFGHSADAVLMVLASAEFDPSDYVDDYDEFLGLVGSR